MSQSTKHSTNQGSYQNSTEQKPQPQPQPPTATDNTPLLEFRNVTFRYDNAGVPCAGKYLLYGISWRNF